MIWNEIRNRLRERLPAIIDFVLYIAAMTMIAAVLLGLTWLYVEYGMALFWVGVAVVIGVAVLSERRAPIHFDDSGPLVLGGDKSSLPPPGKQALPVPGPPPIGRASKAVTKHRPTLPDRK